MRDFFIMLLLTTLGFLIGLSINAVRVVTTDMSCYKRGQIDAINGIINWELQKQEDGSVQWTYIGKENRRGK